MKCSLPQASIYMEESVAIADCRDENPPWLLMTQSSIPVDLCTCSYLCHIPLVVLHVRRGARCCQLRDV